MSHASNNVTTASLERTFEKEFAENAKKQSANNKCLSCIDWTGIGNVLYDIMTACISIADVTTDILVISNFYRKEQFTFFWIALSVVICAQIGYSIAFVVQYVDYYDYKKGGRHFSHKQAFGWFLIGLLFSPVMSFIFYWTSDPDMCLAQIFKHRFSLYIQEKRSDQYTYRYDWVKEEDKKKTEKSQIKEWIEIKLRKHIGFILEAGIELSVCIVLYIYHFVLCYQQCLIFFVLLFFSKMEIK